jgi:hypothetical protein
MIWPSGKIRFRSTSFGFVHKLLLAAGPALCGAFSYLLVPEPGPVGDRVESLGRAVRA